MKFSVGMMKFPIYGKIYKVPKHHPVYIMVVKAAIDHCDMS